MALLGAVPFGFADGDAGHVCDFGSAPGVGQLDVLSVGSDTTVDTPTGFTVGRQDVLNQGGYTFYRLAVGGEGSTVSINTTGNFPTAVVWSRFENVDVLDVAAGAQANGSSGTSAPALSSGALASTTDLVVCTVQLHSIGTANQSAPVWGGGFTAIDTAVNGTAASGARVYVGYMENAGTAAVSPTLSWSGDGCQDRYIQTVAFTTVTVEQPTPAEPGATFTAHLNRLAGTSGETATVAANTWAGTTGRTLTAALNTKAATSGLAVAGACNAIAGTTDLSAIDALSRIDGDIERAGPTNTGHTAWPGFTGSLTAYTGDDPILADGSDQTFEGYSFEGLTIGTTGDSPSNVTFRGCRFRSSWNEGWNVQVTDGTNIVFEYCTFEPLNSQAIPVTFANAYQYGVDIRGESGVTVDRCEFYGFGNGIQLEESSLAKPVQILDSYFHDAADQENAVFHHDGVLSNNGGATVEYITIQGNTIVSGGNTNAIALQSTTDAYSNITIVGNYLSGFGYTVNIGDDEAASNTNVVFTDNVFSTEILPNFGPLKITWPTGNGNLWRRNRWKYSGGNGDPAADGKFWLPTGGAVADWNDLDAYTSDTDYSG